MSEFKNILVGVDLSQGKQLVSSDLPLPGVEAIERAQLLAKANSARMRFFHSLDVSVLTQRTIDEFNSDSKTAFDRSKDVLSKLVERAKSKGIDADFEIRSGQSWLEMIRLVMSDNHDLVVAGSRNLGTVKGFLMGSTGMQLLRKCPCPVWITQPQASKSIKSVLVAHCLRTVGDVAMELGCSIAEMHGAQLHVIHSLQFPELDSVFPSIVSLEKSAAIRSEAQQHIDSQLKKHKFSKQPHVHIVTDAPDFATLQLIKKFDIELLVMGTIARAGIAGFFTGNTAERLLPQIPCSVLAVKPPGFVFPDSN